MYKVYKFSAPWCTPCQQFDPVFKNVMSKSFSNVDYTDVNIDDEKELMEQFKIKTIPTIIVMKGEEEVQRSGRKSSLDFEKWLNESIGTNTEMVDF